MQNFTHYCMFLSQVEKTVDKIKHACQTTNKRLAASMQGSGMDFEKRLVISGVMIISDSVENNPKGVVI